LKVIIDFPTLSHQNEFNSSDEETMSKEEVTKKWKAMAIEVVSSNDLPKLIVSNYLYNYWLLLFQTNIQLEML